MFERLKRLLGVASQSKPSYISDKSRIYKDDNNWVEVKPFTRKDHIIIIFYNYRPKTATAHAEYNRFYIELETSSDIRDFMQWLDGSVSSLLYNNTRAYIEVNYEGKHFIQVTNYGLYKTWQWSTILSKDYFYQIKEYLRSNWSQIPYEKPLPKSINLGRTYSTPLTYNT